jgi:hypothetical protein
MRRCMYSRQTNCGACKTACPANTQCVRGSCVCQATFGDCNSDLGTPTANGCEIDLQTNVVSVEPIYATLAAM